MLRRCVERAVVADHERHARAGKAFNMHRIRLSAGAPHGHQQTLFIKTCVPKRDARAGASEALRLCKFRASVPNGSPLFLNVNLYVEEAHECFAVACARGLPLHKD